MILDFRTGIPKANSVDRGQTAPAPRGAVTVCHSMCIFWAWYSIVKRYSSNFSLFLVVVRMSELLGCLQYTLPLGTMGRLHSMTVALPGLLIQWQNYIISFTRNHLKFISSQCALDDSVIFGKPEIHPIISLW